MKPTWIVQNNLGSTGNYEMMRDYATLAKIPFKGVHLRPFTDDIAEDPSGPIVYYGSCNAVRWARKTAMARGIFDNPEGFLHSTLRKQYGENILNHNSHVMTVGFFLDWAKKWSIYHSEIKFFVRSDDDEKTIAGQVANIAEVYDYLALNPNFTREQRILIAPRVDISAEYRCFVVDAKVISASKYGGYGSKLSNDWVRLNYTIEDVIEFAEHMCEFYVPHRIFVMDVCESIAGLKIVELNGFNSSGFYNADIPKIMDAVNTVVENNS